MAYTAKQEGGAMSSTEQFNHAEWCSGVFTEGRGTSLEEPRGLVTFYYQNVAFVPSVSRSVTSQVLAGLLHPLLV